MLKKDELKRQLARRLSKKLGRRVDASEILDRSEAAKLAGYHPNHWTNGYSDMPRFYEADKTQFGPKGLWLFLRSDVERRSYWTSENQGWLDETFEPTTEEFLEIYMNWNSPH